jgi:dienelactone hydrolase
LSTYRKQHDRSKNNTRKNTFEPVLWKGYYATHGCLFAGKPFSRQHKSSCPHSWWCWAGGDKSEFATAIPVLQQKLPQYAILNVNYRLANQLTNHFPTQENDVRSALQHIVDAASDYGVSKNIILLGASAGAHLALLQSYKYASPVIPKAVISFFGPSNMAGIYNGQSNTYYKMGLQLLIGGTPTTKPEIFQQASPIYFAGKQKVPTLLLHGG